jgi:uncharacterized membrane protein
MKMSNQSRYKFIYDTINSPRVTWALYAVATAAIFFFMMMNAGVNTFTIDDLAQIQISNRNDSISTVISNVLQYDGNPPLNSVFFHFWLMVAPFGLFWLRLPYVLITCAAILVTGILTNKIMNAKYIGIVTMLLLAQSSGVLIEVAYVIRPYAFQFLFSALIAWTYYNRFNESKAIKRRAQILYAIVMLAYLYTHSFGAIICGAVFLCDVYLYIRKRITLKWIIPYCAAGVLFVPWLPSLIYVYTGTQRVSWIPRPTIASLYAVFDFLADYSGVLLVLFFIAFLTIIISSLIKPNIDSTNIPIQEYMPKAIIAVIVIVISSTFIFSYLSESGSIFFYRYFVGLIPFFYMLIVYGLHTLFSLLRKFLASVNNTLITALVCAICIILVFPKTTFNQMVITYRWRGITTYSTTADWLYEQPNIHNDSTLVIFAAPWDVGLQYFLSHDWQRPTVNVVADHRGGAFDRDTIDNYQYIFAYTEAAPLSEITQQALQLYGFSSTPTDNPHVVLYTR